MAENYSGITDTGKARNNNEDTFIAEPVSKNQFIAACVIDGVGGYEGGEIAARLAKDTILSHLRSAKNADITALMKEAVAAANDNIYNEKNVSKKNEQMACVLTLALADLANNTFYYAHVGDTRLYLLRDRSLVKVTHDHSFVGFLEDNGRLSEAEAMRHPKRNEINRALGFDAGIRTTDYIETGASPFLPGDLILLCSDGLTDMIDNKTILSVLQSNKNLSLKGKALIDAANAAGGKDNITVVMVRNNKTPIKQTATKPAITVKNIDNKDDKKQSAELKENSEPVAFQEKKKSNSSTSLFTFLGVLVLAALVWLLYQNYNKRNEKGGTQITAVKKRNEQEQLLIDSINGTKTKEVFVLNQTGAPPVVITDSIFVNKDSLHIIGNGVILKSDETYRGPAFTLSTACKYLLLDSLTLENFDIGILVKNSVLHIKSVQFKNCKIPVQHNSVFSDTSVVTGRFADTLFYDSAVDIQ